MFCSLSTNLSKEDLTLINSLEAELGATLLAYSCHEGEPADISEDKVKKIQMLERKLGVSLVAV